jgi:hypothetical protein
MSILFAAGQHSPGHASQLIRDRDHDFVAQSLTQRLRSRNLQQAEKMPPSMP